MIRNFLLSLILMIPGAAYAQQIVSVRAGVIQFVTGDVFLEDKRLQLPSNGFMQLEVGQRLDTRNGYAEMQLSPGAYLRLGEDSSLRLIENKLGTARLELARGSAMVEALEGSAANPVSVRMSGSDVRIEKDGLYRLNTVPGDLRVYSGEAVVAKDGKARTVRSGRMALVTKDAEPDRFDVGSADLLHQFSARRSFDLFNRTAETRKQTHWASTSAGWVWNSAHRVSFYSELYYLQWVKAEANRKIGELLEKYRLDSQTRTVSNSEYEEILSQIRDAQMAIRTADEKEKRLDAFSDKPEFR